MTCQIIEFPVVFKVSDQQKAKDQFTCEMTARVVYKDGEKYIEVGVYIDFYDQIVGDDGDWWLSYDCSIGDFNRARSCLDDTPKNNHIKNVVKKIIEEALA